MDKLVALLGRHHDGSDSETAEYLGTNADRLISDWTYAGNTSNQSQYGTYTLALAQAFEVPNLPQTVAEDIVRKIIDVELKTVYRALTLARPQQTLPTISLLTQFAKHAPVQLFNQFDFTLKIIPRLLSQQPFREAFLQFYTSLIEKSSAPTRRDLLANRRIISNWFGKLGVEDKEERVLETLELLRQCVLKDTTVFQKTAKMGLFNDWTLRNFARILAGTTSQNLIEQLSRFFTMLLCDKTYGIRIPGGEHKLALSFLKIIKPWENVQQMDLVVRLLQELPDIVVPYFESLATAYPLTPKESMWWFSYSVLHIRALKLNPVKTVQSALNLVAIPSFTQKSADAVVPVADRIIDAVIPVTITNTVLNQALNFSESSLVKFNAAQIILFTLRRVKTVIEKVFVPRQWNQQAFLELLFQKRIPEINSFARAGVEPELLKTTFLIILKEIGQLVPLSIPVQMDFEPKQVLGLDLVQVENILEVQTLTSDQTKWWNSPAKNSLSLFTQLLQIATYNLRLTDKCGKLLQYLVEPTQLFADMQTLAHPIVALIFTVSSNHNEMIWNVLEQAMQRATRSPYQYIDKVQSEKVSPLIVALIEQYVQHFANKEPENVALHKQTREWIRRFANSLAVLGEDQSAIQALLAPLQKYNDVASESDYYFDFVLEAPNESILGRNDLVYKMTNKLELAATIHRIVTTESPKVRNHLLANIPADVATTMVEQPSAFKQFLGKKELLEAFLASIDPYTSEALRAALEASQFWNLSLERLSTGFLQIKFLAEHDAKVLKELTRREVQVHVDALQNALLVDGMRDNLKLWKAHSIPASLGLELLATVTKDAGLAAELIKISGAFAPNHLLAKTSPVMIAVAKYAPEQLDSSEALQVGYDLLNQGDASGLSIVAQLHNELTEDSMLWPVISAYIEKSKTSGGNLSVLVPELVVLSSKNASFLPRWLKIAVHQLTKRYAENKVSADLYEFVKAFNSIILADNNAVQVWQQVNHNSLNALIEAVLRHDSSAPSFELVSRIALNSHPLNANKLASLSHLSILMEKPLINDPEVARLEAMATYGLVAANVESSATLVIEQGLLARYNGSSTAQDRLLLLLLEKIESVRQRSWVDNVHSWDVRAANTISSIIDEYEKDPLVMVKSGYQLFVTLDEERIRHTIQQFESALPALANVEEVLKYDVLQQRITQYDIESPFESAILYDNEFLLNLIVSCDYLFEKMETFLSSGLVSFVFCCLTSPALNETATRVLKHVFTLLRESQYKEATGTRLLLGKVLMLLEQMKEKQLQLPSHIPVIAGQIAAVLSKPNHFLYEKVSSWLLASPSIRDFDIPLCKAIVGSQSDFKLREMLWQVNSLKSGAVDEGAVQAYIKAGVIEWCLSHVQLLNTKSYALKEAVWKMMDRIEELRGGSHSLMKTSGALAVPELQQRIFYSVGSSAVSAYANPFKHNIN